MAYAAYREFQGTTNPLPSPDRFHVLDVTVACRDASLVRRAAASCPGAGVVRCEVLLHERASTEDDAPRVRLMIRLPTSSYAQLLHGLCEAVPSGELGRLMSWRDHLQRCGFKMDRP